MRAAEPNADPRDSIAADSAARPIVLRQMIASTALFAPLLFLPMPMWRLCAVALAALYLSNMATMIMIARLAALPDAIIVRKLLKVPAVWAAGAPSPLLTALIVAPIAYVLDKNAMEGLLLILNVFGPLFEGAEAALPRAAALISIAVAIVLLYRFAYAFSTRLVVSLVKSGRERERGLYSGSALYGLKRVFVGSGCFFANLGGYAASFAIAAALLVAFAVMGYDGAFGKGASSFDFGSFARFFKGGALGTAVSFVAQWQNPVALVPPLLAGYTWGLGFGAYFWPRRRARHVRSYIDVIN